MNVNQFPSSFNASVDERMNEELRKARERNTALLAELDHNNQEARSKDSSAGSTLITLGWVGGFFACACSCFLRTGESDTELQDGILAGIITWIIVGVIAVVIGLLISQEYSDQIKHNEKRKESSGSDLQKELDKIVKRANKEKESYLELFEKKSQEAAVNYIDSDITKEIVSFLANIFFLKINTEDRAEYKKIVSIDFWFEVYSDKVVAEYSQYLFEEHRCPNLASPIEQAGLAQALFLALELNTHMKYPNDPSGSVFTISKIIDYEYDKIKITVNYSAPNAGYQGMREW